MKPLFEKFGKLSIRSRARVMKEFNDIPNQKAIEIAKGQKNIKDYFKKF